MNNLILLHGALGSAEQMLALAVELESHFKIHLLEFDGHGKSAASPSELSIENLAEQLELFIHERKLGQAYVFGYSMGGYVALCNNLRNPDSIQKIACLATKFDWNPETAQQEASLLSPLTILEKFPGFAKLLEQRHGFHWKLVLEKTADLMIRLGHHPLLNHLTLPNINTPCLLLLGDKDHMVSKEETKRVAELLPDAQLEILQNTIHPLEKINIYLLKSALLKFFNIHQH